MTDDIRDRVRDWTGDPETPLAASETSRAADSEWLRGQQWARDCIAETRALEPDWDLELEKVRASYGMTER